MALAYIAEHRTQLEPKLKVILEKAAERECYYRTLAAEIEKQRSKRMTQSNGCVCVMLCGRIRHPPKMIRK